MWRIMDQGATIYAYQIESGSFLTYHEIDLISLFWKEL